MRPGIEALVAELLDDMDGDSHDVMTQLATLLPVNVIGKMLGVPPPDRAQFRPWTNDIFSIFSFGVPSPATIRRGAQSLFEMRAYLQALIDERRLDPRDDLLSHLIEMSRAEGSPLTDDVVLANCVTLYTAGHETTSGFIGNAFLALFRHPDQLARLRDGAGPHEERCRGTPPLRHVGPVGVAPGDRGCRDLPASPSRRATG